MFTFYSGKLNLMKKEYRFLSLLRNVFSVFLNSNTDRDRSRTLELQVPKGSVKADVLVASKLKELLWEFGDRGKPGFVYQAKYDNGVLYEGAIGLASVESEQALVATDVFYMGAITKQFTAFAILLLEQDKKLSLDDSLYKFMPELGEHVRPIKISHLIQHTSGLSDYSESAYQKGISFYYDLRNKESLAYVQELVKTESNSIGKSYGYCNKGYFLLSHIVERVTGMSFNDFCKKRIFEPLGMRHTSMVNSLSREEHPVVSHDKSDKIDRDDPWTHTDDGQVRTNAHDLMLWGKNMARYHKLSPYGMRIKKVNGRSVLQHSGKWMSYGGNFIRIPTENLTIAVFSNSANINVVSVSQKILKILLN